MAFQFRHGMEPSLRGLTVPFGVKSREAFAFADSDAAAVVAAMSVEPFDWYKRIIDRFVLDLKAASIWTKIDAMWWLAAHDEQAGRLNWKSPGNFTLTAVNSPTFTAFRGFAGDGAASYLDTTWDPATNGVQFTRDNAHLSLYSRTAGTGSNAHIGFQVSAATFIRGQTGTNALARINRNGSSVGGTSGGTLPLHYIVRRSSSAQAELLRDGVQIATGNAGSDALGSSDIFMGRANSTYTTAQLAFASLGANLDDTEALAFYNACHNYAMAVGADT